MKKIALTVGILTGLGLVMTFSGHGQEQKHQKESATAVVTPDPDSLDIYPPLPPLPPLPPISPMAPIPPVPPVPPAPPAFSFQHHYFAGLFDRIYRIQDDSLRKKKLAEANKKLEAEMKAMEEEMRQAEIEIAKAEKEIQKANDEMEKAELEMKKAELEMQRAEIEMANAELEMVKAQKEMEKAHVESKRHNDLHSRILKELEAKFGKVDSYSFSNKELVVNGKKQSDELHKQLAEKYIGKNKVAIVYSNKKGSQSISTSIESED